MGLLSSSRGSHRAGVEGQTWRPWSRGAGMLLWERYRSGLPGYGQKRRKSRGKEAKREPRARATPNLLEISQARVGAAGPRGQESGARGGLPGSPPRKGRPRPRSDTAWWGPGAC